MRRRALVRGGLIVAGASFIPSLSACLADESEAGREAIERGVNVAPGYGVPVYDPSGRDIPAKAIDAAAFDNLVDWLDAIEAEGCPGRIGSGTYALHGIGKRIITQSIYGYDTGGGRPVLVGGEGDAFYCHGDDVTMQYMHWRDWKCPIIRLSNWVYENLQFSSSRTNSGYFDPATSPFLDADWERIKVLDSVFERCDTGIAFLSDRFRIADVHIARNEVTGGKGFVCLMCHVHDGIYLYQNSISKMPQGESKGEHVGTIFWVGYNASQPRGRCGPVHTDYNECRDVTSDHAYSKINGSVFADIRQATGWTCRGNIVERCTNSAGHPDCNAIYGKSYDILIEGNLLADNGANATDDREGSEGAHITFKGGDAEGNSYAHTVIRDNVFRCGSVNTVSAILLSHEAEIAGNRFEGYVMSVPVNSHGTGIIRSYSGGPIHIGPNTFVGCGNMAGAGRYCYLISGDGNMSVEGLVVDFDDNATAILRNINQIIDCTNERGEPLIDAA